MSIAWCGARCTASTYTRAPTACAASMIGARSGTVPSRFEAPGSVTHFVRSSISAITFSGGSVPGRRDRTAASTCSAPACSHASRHGVTLASWSRRVPTTRSPGRSVAADRTRDRERERRHVRAEADAGRVGAEQLPDDRPRAGRAARRTRSAAANGPPPAAVLPLAIHVDDRLDRRVDHLRAGGRVEARPAVGDAGEAVAQRRVTRRGPARLAQRALRRGLGEPLRGPADRLDVAVVEVADLRAVDELHAVALPVEAVGEDDLALGADRHARELDGRAHLVAHAAGRSGSRAAWRARAASSVRSSATVCTDRRRRASAANRPGAAERACQSTTGSDSIAGL